MNKYTFREWIHATDPSYQQVTEVYSIAKDLGWDVMIYHLRIRIRAIAKRYK